MSTPAKVIRKCACGKRISQYSTECSACAAQRRATMFAQAQKIVEAGVCPDCGAGLRRNYSIAGWWQCRQLGAEGFREDPSKPPCSFQCFTC
jgi:hypothetical protein